MAVQTQDFFQKINEAYATRNIDFLLENMTDDVVWKMVGTDTLRGKEEIAHFAEAMEDSPGMELTIDQLIAHETEASLYGKLTMKTADGETQNYAYSDFYRLTEDGKVKELVSFIIEEKKDR